MVIIMILAFLVCWSPYAAFSILVTAHPTIELDARLSAIPAFFAKTASMYNPVIYVFMNKQVCSVCSILVSCTLCFLLQKNGNTYFLHMWPHKDLGATRSLLPRVYFRKCFYCISGTVCLLHISVKKLNERNVYCVYYMLCLIWWGMWIIVFLFLVFLLLPLTLYG